MMDPLRRPGQIATPRGCRSDKPPRLRCALATSIALVLTSALGTGGATAAPPVGVVSAIGARATSEPVPGAESADPGAEFLRSGGEDKGWLGEQIRRFREYPRLHKAYRLIARGRLEGARAELEAAVARNVRDPAPRAALARVLYQLDDYKQAVRQTSVVLALTPAATAMRLLRGLSYVKLGNDSAALADLRAVADDQSAAEADRVYALNIIAERAIVAGDLAAALPVLKEVRALRPDADVDYKLGLVLRGLHRPDEAAVAFADALAAATEDADRYRILLSLGYNEPARGDLDAAKRAFGKAHSLEPKDPRAMRALADVALRQHDLAAAESWVRAALAVRPSTSGRLMLADILITGGRREEALTLLDALAGEPLTPKQQRWVHMSQGYVRYALGKLDGAIAAFQAANRDAPDSAGLAALAQALADAGRDGEALTALDKALRMAPSADLHARAAMLYLRKGDDAAAVRHIEAADDGASLDPTRRFELLANKGYALQRLGAPAAAAKAFGEAAALRAEPKLLTAWSQALVAAGQIKAAIAVLERSRKLAPGPTIDRELGLLDVRAGDQAQAIEQLRAAADAETDPVRGAADLAQLGQMLVAADRLDEAREALTAAVKVAKDPDPLYRALGQIALTERDYAGAQRWLERAGGLSEHPQDLKALSYAYSQNGDPKAAINGYIRYLKVARPKGREHAEIMTTLGVLYDSIGDADGAIASFAAAVPDAPRRAEAHLRLARVLAKAGRWRRARKEYARCADLGAGAEALAGAGNASMKLSEPAAAVRYLERVLKKRPGSLPAKSRRQVLEQLSQAYVELGDYAGAERVLTNFPHQGGDAALRLRLGVVQRRAGHLAKAQATLNGIDPAALPPQGQAERLDEIALIAVGEGRLAEGTEARRQAYAIVPNLRRRLDLAMLYQQNSDSGAVIALLEPAAAEAGANPQLLMTLGYAYKDAGRIEHAVHTFEAVTALRPDDPRPYVELGYLALRQSDNGQAVTRFREAIDRLHAAAR